MKLLLLLATIMISLFSCKSKKNTSYYNSNIASLTYKLELNYLQKTISNYSNLSDYGRYIYEQNLILDKRISELKKHFEEQKSISIQERNGFFNYFEPIFKEDSVYFDLKGLKQLRNCSVENLSDIDLLNLFLKRSFVSKLNRNKFLSFDIWGVMATVDKWKIKNGEKFRMQINTTAASSTKPAEWYILKDGTKNLTKDNILDTLKPGEFGEVIFETKKYKKGINKISVVVRFKTPDGEQTLERNIEFTVE